MSGTGIPMRSMCRTVVWAAAAMLLAAGSAVAQDKQKSSPVGGQWQQSTQTEATVAGITLDAKQMDAINRVNAYFNSLENLKGNFVQTNPDRARLRGKMFVKKPGKLRFEYSLPSKQLIVSDGQQVAIQDWDIGTDDRIKLDNTPFRILLRKDVDLLRDARISEVQEADDLLIVSLQDKSPDAPGRIRLFMSKAPQLEIKEWVTTDSQGQDTRVEVSNLVKTEEIEKKQFEIQSPQLKRL